VKTPSWRKILEDSLFEDGFQRSAELDKFIDQYSETTRGILREGGVKVVR
jgi:tripartite-type tricarboxylate transporter receptor subunit TctC